MAHRTPVMALNVQLVAFVVYSYCLLKGLRV